MSGGNHPDLDRFYEALEAGEGIDLDDDEDDDGFDLYLDEIDEIIDEDDDEDDEFYDDDDDDDEDDEEDDDEEGEEGMDVEFEDAGDEDEDDDTAPGGDTWLNLAELLNSAGGTLQARSALLARLLGGPTGARAGGAATRFRPVQTAEERARAMAERRRKERWWKPQTEPSERGVDLLNSGEFGRVGDWRRRRGLRQPARRERLITRAQVS